MQVGAKGRVVTIPHTWNVEEGSNGHYGWGWYQKTVQVPGNWKNKQVLLQFGAVNHSCVVYLNGRKLAEHRGDGFNKFQVKLDGKLLYGKENILTVGVNNDYGKSKVPYGSSFDWPNDGGIIRPVSFIVSGRPAAQYLKLTPTPDLSNKRGSLQLKLGFDERSDMRLRVSVTEENQPTRKVVYQGDLLPQWNGKEATAAFQISNVNPWHFDHPNLYRVDVSVIKGNKIVDKISANTGFREIRFINGQTHLNGERVKLMGVEWTAGSHPGYGFAEPDSMILAMGKLMKEVNCIFSRLHFQQSDLFYDFCDRNGILLQQEVPLWGPETPATTTVREIAGKQLEDMVNNLYNHPSIFAWGTGNELRARDKDMKQMIRELLQQSRQLDTTRFTGYVSNTLTQGFYNRAGFVPDAAAEGDYLMMNEYGGSWWQLSAGQIGMYLDSVHQTYPGKPFFISEFGLCEPNFMGGDKRRAEDLIYHMSLYESKPYIEGAIYFDLTDYRTHYPGTPDTGKYRQRVHGVYDWYGNPKPSMKVLREYSSPVEVLGLRGGKKGKMLVTLVGSIGLPQHRVKGYRLYLSDKEGNYAGSRAYEIPELEPGQQLSIEVDDLYQGSGIVTVVRPAGYIATQRSFYWNERDQ